MHVEATHRPAQADRALARAFLQLTLVSLGALWLIVVTGAAVRVTDSGLGCRHWPGCEQGHPLPAKDYHAFIEFGNRAIGGVVIVLVLLTAVSSFFVPGLSRRGAAAGARDLCRHARPGAARLPRGPHRPPLAGRGGAPAALDGLLAGAVVLALEALALRSGRAEPVAPLELRRGGLVVTARRECCS